jgi:enoyl-CoA hydratase/carnithine racemase
MARWMAKSLLQELIKSIITCTKPIFAIIQGRCTGFGFTQLALFDKVFAVDGARFRAPLVKLGQGP